MIMEFSALLGNGQDRRKKCRQFYWQAVWERGFAA